MKQLLLLTILSCGNVMGFTQPQTSRLIFLMNPDILPIYCWSRDQYEIRDTSLLTVRYRMFSLFDPNSDRRVTNDMILQIGPKWCKYYSLVREDRDIDAQSTNTMNTQLGNPSSLPKKQSDLDAMGCQSINGELWINRTNQTIKERYHSLKKYNESIEYEDSIPNFNWILYSDTLTVCEKHVCVKACTRFRGRDWIVWYTPEIPINAGPWKFNGLPGLILRAEDSKGEYIWECVGLSAKADELLYYKTKLVTPTTREKYKLFIKNYHDAPLFFLSEGQANLRVRTKDRALDETWTIPYNPIELE